MREVVEVEPDSQYFRQVLELWRSQSGTLGFLPEGGFKEHASKKLLLAVCEGANLFGYLLYRRSGVQATIVHLCSAPKYRKQGLARMLIDGLRIRTRDCAGIGLKCRQDFKENQVWPKFNFAAVGECVGRSKDAKRLTIWWSDNCHKNLLSVPPTTTALRIVLDANIFFDLCPNAEPFNEESHALQSDWLVGLIELCVTDEIFNEIHRHANEERRKANRAFAKSFPILSAPHDSFEAVVKKLRPILSDKGTESDQSDFRQVLKSITNQISVFVTRDSRLLGISFDVFAEFGLRIIRPVELIVELDALRHEDQYQPIRLAETRCTVTRASKDDFSRCAEVFQNAAQREKKTEFTNRLAAILVQTQKCKLEIIQTADEQPIALIGYDYSKESELRIPCLRLRQGPQASTLVRHLLFSIVKHAVSRELLLIRLTDSFLQDETSTALQEEFSRSKFDWLKVCPRACGDCSQLSLILDGVANSSGESLDSINPFGNGLSLPITPKSTDTVLKIERRFWPFKVKDGNIPCFIIPIRPEWAKHLVDQRLAKGELLGADESVAMNREAVYYRAARPAILTAPARVYWYVSREVKELCATSLITEVEVGSARELFAKNRRYGVYHRQHVKKLAKGNLDNRIMAIRFVDTEVLPAPIKFKALKPILRAADIKTTHQSPVLISPTTYFELYRLAAGGRK